LVTATPTTNTSDEPLVVRSVRLRSEVFGLTFLAYETRVDMQVAPGETAERSFQLELLGLKGQATGLLPARIELLDAERNATATVPLAIDVQGSGLSVYASLGGRAGATVGEARATEPLDGAQPPSARAALRPPSARRESAVREHGP
jgi:hypothetical protein